MKEVIKYQAEDGTLCNTEEEALAVDKIITLEQRYKRTPIYLKIDRDPASRVVGWGDLIVWMTKYPKLSQAILTHAMKTRQHLLEVRESINRTLEQP